MLIANIEFELGISGTYYFRSKPWVFKPKIIEYVKKSLS